MTNHLGNVLSVVTDNHLPVYVGGVLDHYVAQVVQAQDYTAFGAAMEGRSFSISSYRFGFQGMEKEGELYGDGNAYYTQYRMLDVRIGRWFSTDPVVQPWMSPYSAFDNNPIFLVDPLGLKAIGGDGDPEKKSSKGGTTRTNETTTADPDLQNYGEFGSTPLVTIRPEPVQKPRTFWQKVGGFFKGFGGGIWGRTEKTSTGAYRFISQTIWRAEAYRSAGKDLLNEAQEVLETLTFSNWQSSREEFRRRFESGEQPIVVDHLRVPDFGSMTTEEIGDKYAGDVFEVGAMVGVAIAFKSFSSVGRSAMAVRENNKLLRSASIIDKGGLTKAGRSLQKHGSRIGSKYPVARGNADAINNQAQNILKSILNDPNVVVTKRYHAKFGDIMDIKSPSGLGARFTKDGTEFIHFLE